MTDKPEGIDPNPQSATVASVVDAPEPAASPAGVSDAAPAPATPAGGEPSPAGTDPKLALEPGLLTSFLADEKAAADKKPAAEAPKEPVKEPSSQEKKPDAAPPAADKPVVPAAPEPVAYEYRVPETLVVNDEQRGNLHKALDAFRADPAKGVQGLIDLHTKTMQEFAEAQARDTLTRQYETFNGTLRDWRQNVMADEELGGSGHKTVMKSVARATSRFVDDDHRGAFDNMLKVTGIDSHPEFLRLLYRFQQFIDEPTPPPPNAQPTKDVGKNPHLSRERILYGPKAA